MLEKTLESPLNCKEIKPVHPKKNQSLIFIRGTDTEAEAPILGHLIGRANSQEKTLMLGKIEDRRKGDNREDEMVGYYHQLDGHEFEHALGVGDGQGILAAVHGVSKSWTGLSD